MSFILKYPHNPKIQPLAKDASTAFVIDSLVAGDEDADDQAFVYAAATAVRAAGVLQQAIAATDSDYALASKKPVLQDVDGEWLISVLTGTADVNDEQGYVDLDDSSPHLGVDVTTSTYGLVYVTRYVSGTQVIGQITGWNHNYAPASD